jgi:type IV pilus assembly protein PilB
VATPRVRDDLTPEPSASGSGPAGRATVGQGPPGRDGDTANPRQRIGDLLVDAGVITTDQLEHALEDSRPGERLGAALLRRERLDEHELADVLARQARLDRIDIDRVTPDESAVRAVPERIAARHGIVPVSLERGVLVIAVDDPTDFVAFDDVRMAANVRSVRPVVATSSALKRARARLQGSDRTGEAIAQLVVDDEPEQVEDVDDDQPVIRLVNGLISDALRARASDLHIEPDAQGVAVRARVDGLLRELRRLPRSLGRQVVSRLKIMGTMDIAERRLPQDGRSVLRLDGREVDLRLSTMPTMYGETVVIRLLPKGGERLELTELGLGAHVLEPLLDTLQRPQGLVLVTGPTGSGKTSTLYAGLAAVADPTRNVLTLEDPIEVELPGVNQTQIDPRIGLTFARGLRHVLRQDPDVVLVGEIRDQETAQLAVEASFTGHLVLATLHTNDAPSAVARLVDLGADRFLIASSLLLVVAQRLARRICPNCAEAAPPDSDLLERLGLDDDGRTAGDDDGGTARWRRGTGCEMCEGTGTHGRVAIGELLTIDAAIRDLVIADAAESTIARAARSRGLVPLRAEAIRRARRGEIELAEARRITPDPDLGVATGPQAVALTAPEAVPDPPADGFLDDAAS